MRRVEQYRLLQLLLLLYLHEAAPIGPPVELERIGKCGVIGGAGKWFRRRADDNVLAASGVCVLVVSEREVRGGAGGGGR